MKYDFNKPVDRSIESSVKYDELEKKFGTKDVLPFWIADMDIRVPEPVIETLKKRVESGIYGYTYRPDSYNESIAAWQNKRNHWNVSPDQMSFAFGVVQSMVYFVKEYTQKGDSVLLFSPVYTNFFGAITDWGRVPLVSELVEENGHYTIDFEDFEEQLKQGPKMLFMCNPHNPVGRSWTVEELTRIAQLCKEYNVGILSDEIHSDLMLWGNKHNPMALLKSELVENLVTCISTSKTFNLAGIQAATIIFENKKMKEKYDAYWQAYHLDRNSAFSQCLVEAAYTQGEEWLDQLLVHIEGNVKYVKDFLDENIPIIKTQLPESTYLMWLDFRSLGMNSEELNKFMIKKARLALNDGSSYGAGGNGFMRFNVACPRPMVEEAMRRLKQAVDTL